MSTINPYSGLGISTLDTAKTSKPTSLAQDEFLKLMTTQMTHQDPTKPMENNQFLSQMAQFGTVSGIQDLQKSFKDFSASISSDQALQAASLVGRNVSVPSDVGLLSAGGEINGNFDLSTSSPDVDVVITDPQTGDIIRKIPLGQQSAGAVPFSWDGLDSNGTPVSQFDPPSNFRLMIPVCRVPAEPDVVVKHNPCLLRNPDKPCNWSLPRDQFRRRWILRNGDRSVCQLSNALTNRWNWLSQCLTWS